MNAWDYFAVMGAAAIGGGIAGSVMFYVLLERLVFCAPSRHRTGPAGPPDSTSGPGATAIAPAVAPHPGPEVAPAEPWYQEHRPSPGWQQPPLVDPRELLTAPPAGDPAAPQWRDMPPARVIPLVREHLA